MPLLVVDADPLSQETCATALEPAGFKVDRFECAKTAIQHVTPEFQGVILSDIRPRGMDGFALLDKLRSMNSSVPTILMSSAPNRVSEAVRAMRSGAFDFIEKPFCPGTIVESARRAIAHCNAGPQPDRWQRSSQGWHGLEDALQGDSPVMRKLRFQLANVADTSASVLLCGETGTGKEVAARALHEMSSRREGRFVALNCGGIPESLFESEVFGHEAGAFTGAARRRIGKIEHANGGTLFLDEIETMPLGFQTKLLRVLQERRIERLGSNMEIPVDVRVIAATKSDLRRLGQQGIFRSDLYYRLNVVEIDLPPLRDRREDIAMLLAEFMAKASCLHNRPVPMISSELMQSVMLHDWPGNVRELRNFSERLVLGFQPTEVDGPQCKSDVGTPLAERLEHFECAVLQQELQRHQGCARSTMLALHLPKRTFYDKVNKHGIRLKAYRAAS